MERKARVGISLALPAGAESTPSRRSDCTTGGHAARDDDHVRAALPLKATGGRAERAEDRAR
jgi:hypothetical protein